MDFYSKTYYNNPSLLFFIPNFICTKSALLNKKTMLKLPVSSVKFRKNSDFFAESGFAVADPILDNLYDVYQQKNAHYWVIENNHGVILGGGGISPLQGDSNILEIQKMYFSAEIRGHGFAKQILSLAFEFAAKHGIHFCYLETTTNLWQAVKLYEKLGFQHLSAPKGNTGHSHACEI